MKQDGGTKPGSDELRIIAASDEDAENLARIRVEAMRPSLEAIGRFDPERARNRFLSTFTPSDTHVISVGEETVGFYVLRRRTAELYLDHLYLRNAYQGRGIGHHVIERIKRDAREVSLPIRLTALKGSPANDFYRRCGFVLLSADELDNHLEWRAL